jgi:hypothetical protein
VSFHRTFEKRIGLPLVVCRLTCSRPVGTKSGERSQRSHGPTRPTARELRLWVGDLAGSLALGLPFCCEALLGAAGTIAHEHLSDDVRFEPDLLW